MACGPLFAGPFARASVFRPRLAVFLLSLFGIQTLALSVEPANAIEAVNVLTAEPPRINALLDSLRLANHSAPGSASIVLQPCDAELPPLSVFGLAEGSASEEWLRMSGACSCGSSCALSRPLRYEHGALELVRLMPPAFQAPEEGHRLNARAVPYTPQHERAAAVVARAKRYIALRVQTVGGGPDKLALRRLLLVLTIALLGACFAAVLLKVVTVIVHRTTGKP